MIEADVKPSVHDSCASSPEEVYAPAGYGSPRLPRHSCAHDRLECVYCGVALRPEQCNGCGRFLSARELADLETRCEECR